MTLRGPASRFVLGASEPSSASASAALLSMDTSIALGLMVARAAIVGLLAGTAAFSAGWEFDLIDGLAGGGGADAASNSVAGGCFGAGVGLVGLMGVVTDVLDV